MSKVLFYKITFFMTPDIDKIGFQEIIFKRKLEFLQRLFFSLVSIDLLT